MFQSIKTARVIRKFILFSHFLLAADLSHAQTSELGVREKINLNLPSNTSKAITAEKIRETMGVMVDYTKKMTPHMSVAQLRSGKADTASVIQVINNSRVYNYRFDPASTADDDSATVIKSGSRRYVIDADYVTPRMFGAKGDSITDDTKAFRKAFYSGRKVYIDAGKYRISSTLIVNYNNLRVEGEGRDKVLIFSNNLKRIVTFYGASNSSIRNIAFKIYTTDTTSTLPNEWCVGWHLDPTGTVTMGPKAYNNEIVNCSFSAPNASINGVKLIAHRSGFGGTLRNFRIDNCNFESLGRMGVEVLGETTGNWYSKISVTNCTFQDLGRVSVYGMAVSFSGDGSQNIVENAKVDGARDIAMENSGAQYTVFSNITYSNLKAACLPWTVSGYDGYTVRQGNSVVNNRVLGVSPSAPQFINQVGFKSNGNEVDSPAYSIISDVSESSFIGDSYNSSGTATIVIRNTSSKNIFENCVIGSKGATAYATAIHIQNTATNNSFSHTIYTKGSGGGTFVGESGTSTTKVQNLFDSGNAQFFNFNSDYSKKGQLLTIGNNFYWVDASGSLRTKSTPPTNDFHGDVFLKSVPGTGTYFPNPDGSGAYGIVNTSGRMIVGATADDGINRLQVIGSVKATQFRVSALNTAPASATAAGTLGEVRYTDTGIYWCIATNTWMKVVGTTTW